MNSLSARVKLSLLIPVGTFMALAGLIFFAPQTQATNTTYYVNNAAGAGCLASNAGTLPSAPLCTIQQAVNKLTGAGDRIIIYPGTYAESVQITPAQTSANGTAASPIIIEGLSTAPRSSIIIDGSAGTSAIYIDGSSGTNLKTHFIFRHFSLKTGTQFGIFGGAHASYNGYTARLVIRDIEVHSINFPPTSLACTAFVITAGNWEGSAYLGDNRTLIEDIVIDNDLNGGTRGQGCVVVALGANNVVRNITAKDVLAFGRFGTGTTVEFNKITNMTCQSDEGCVQFYNSGGSIFRYNVLQVPQMWAPGTRKFLGIRATDAGKPPPSAIIENNVFDYTGAPDEGEGIRFDSYTRYASVRNNLFVGFNQANSEGIVSTSCPVNYRIEYNAFYNSTAYVGQSCVTVATSTPGATNYQTNTIDFNTTTYVPNAGSRLINAGAPDLSIPLGGG